VAYRFQRGEAVPQEIRRIAKEQLEGAAASLEGRGNRDAAIHDARKRVKKTRALLRLVKQELGEVFDAENARLREAGRSLSEFRDAVAIIDTFDELREKYRKDLGRHNLDSVRRGLLLHKARGRSNVKETLREISATLARCARRTAKWPVAADGFAALAAGLQDTYRQGGKAMAYAHKHPRPEHFHEWRKRVKDHWYHIRLLEDVWGDVMEGYEKSLKDLEDWLGTGHNLTVLRGRVTAEPEFYGSSKDIDVLLAAIAHYEKDVHERALEMGAKVYSEAPRRFRRRMERLWDAWQG
jgi:CHAD domain-containing protein